MESIEAFLPLQSLLLVNSSFLISIHHFSRLLKNVANEAA